MFLNVYWQAFKSSMLIQAEPHLHYIYCLWLNKCKPEVVSMIVLGALAVKTQRIISLGASLSSAAVTPGEASDLHAFCPLKIFISNLNNKQHLSKRYKNPPSLFVCQLLQHLRCMKFAFISTFSHSHNNPGMWQRCPLCSVTIKIAGSISFRTNILPTASPLQRFRSDQAPLEGLSMLCRTGVMCTCAFIKSKM